MKKKIIIPIIVLILIVISVGALILWSGRQEKINYCKQMCSYETEADAWQCCGSEMLINIYGDRYFPTLEECINYCLIRDADYRKHPEWFQ